MDEAIVCLSAVFFYPLFIEEEEGFLFFFSLFFVSCSFVCVCVCVFVRGGVICVACIITIFANRRYSFQALLLNTTFLLRYNRLIDYFFSTVAIITFIQQWCCHFIGSSIPAATRRYARRRWRRRFRLLVAILLRSWRLLCLTI